MASSFHLARGVHACRLDGSVILLDLNRDRYLRLNPVQTDWYTELARIRDAAPPGPSAARFAASLAGSGLLTVGTSTGKPLLPPNPSPARSSMIDTYVEDVEAIDRQALWHMARAVRICRPFGRPADRNALKAVEVVSKWSSAGHVTPRSPDACVRRRVMQFHRLAPYFMTTHDACFFASMVLMRFLLSFGIRPDWVFGVRLSPFDAHCWVRLGDTLLNETRDKAAEYRVIMQL
jgi:hypothetical protein